MFICIYGVIVLVGLNSEDNRLKDYLEDKGK